MKNNFLKFCIQVILFILILFVVDKGIGDAFGMMKNIGIERNPKTFRLKTNYIIEKLEADVVVVGSSKAARHYVPQILEDSLGMTAYNAGQDGSFFLYQNCILNMILDRYNPKAIIWDIQPESFCNERGIEEYQNYRNFSPYYYDNNSWAYNYINEESSKMKYRMYSRMFAYNSLAISYLSFVTRKGQDLDRGFLPFPNEGYKYPSLDKIDEKEYKIPQAYLNILESTIKRCQDLGVDINVFMSPAFSIKNKALLAAEKAIKDTSKANGVKCYSFYSDSVFLSDSTLFKDALHLNGRGARKYTEMVAGALKHQ